MARRTRPSSTAALAMAANPDLVPADQQKHLARFVADHLAHGEYDRLLYEMVIGSLPADTLGLVARAVAVQGTARPYVAVVTLAVMTAHHWREIRRRLHAAGITDPMALPSMHAVLDITEHTVLEWMHSGDPKADDAKRQQFYDRIYAPTPDGTQLNGSGSVARPAGFEPEQVEASFDAFTAAMR